MGATGAEQFSDYISNDFWDKKISSGIRINELEAREVLNSLEIYTKTV